MRAMIVEPMQPPRIEEIEPTLRNLQSIVGGYIEIVPAELGDSALVICNEEGKIDNLPPNRFVYDEEGIPYDMIAGTFIICDENLEGELASITPEHEAKYMERYSNEMIISDGEMHRMESLER